MPITPLRLGSTNAPLPCCQGSRAHRGALPLSATTLWASPECQGMVLVPGRPGNLGAVEQPTTAESLPSLCRLVFGCLSNGLATFIYFHLKPMSRPLPCQDDGSGCVSPESPLRCLRTSKSFMTCKLSCEMWSFLCLMSGEACAGPSHCFSLKVWMPRRSWSACRGG